MERLNVFNQQHSQQTREANNHFFKSRLPDSILNAVQEKALTEKAGASSKPAKGPPILKIVIPFPEYPRQTFAQHGLPANTLHGQGQHRRPPGNLMIRAGQLRGDDDSNSSMSSDSNEEQETLEKILTARERRWAGRARRVEKAVAVHSPPDDRPPSRPRSNTPANPNNPIRIVVEHHYPIAGAGNSECDRSFKRTVITPPSYIGSADMDLRAWLTSLELYFHPNQWM